VSPGRKGRQLPCHKTAFGGPILGRGGKAIASGGSDGATRLWDLATRKQLRKLDGHQGPVLTLSFSADGRRLVPGSRDTTALILEVAGVLPALSATPFGAAELWGEGTGIVWHPLSGSVCSLEETDI
jgi:WD40 repeat protein